VTLDTHSTPKAILALDPAWTEKNASGVCLIAGDGLRWRVVALAPSYGQFIAGCGNDPSAFRDRTVGGSPAPQKLLDAAKGYLCGALPDAVIADIPLSLATIEGRRVADDRVSVAYGARHCGTHTPSPHRPGPISVELRKGFGDAGFRLATAANPTEATKVLVETYPHPALLCLLGRPSRVPYKVGNVRKYWPSLDTEARHGALISEWTAIVTHLSDQISGIHVPLPTPSTPRWLMKQVEDGIDALICAWVGMLFLAGQCIPYGDADSAIWLPKH
jgi:predicted RNase H-like nuclease